MTSVDVDEIVPVSYSSLISATDEDGSYMLSSVLPVFIFGLRATVDLEVSSKTTLNMTRTGQCVLNLPSDEVAGAVNRLAQLASDRSHPRAGSTLWYSYLGKEFQSARLTPAPSEAVLAPRALECPVQLEAEVTNRRCLDRETSKCRSHIIRIEARILRVHLDPAIVLDNHLSHGASAKWQPLMMCLRKAYQPL